MQQDDPGRTAMNEQAKQRRGLRATWARGAGGLSLALATTLALALGAGTPLHAEGTALRAEGTAAEQTPPPATCRADRVVLQGPEGETARFRVELAQTNAERARGLMHRTSMPLGAGMLFIFQRPQTASFWMKNTFIPLDILYFDAAGVLKTIQADAVPQDLTPLPGGTGIQYVLEINGGLADRMGIRPGDVLMHPAVDPAQAARPCIAAD